MVFIIHYSEIALKGKNRGFFENILMNNIKLALAPFFKSSADFSIKKDNGGRLILQTDGTISENEISNRLKKIFGIANFAPTFHAKCDIENLKTLISSNIKTLSFETFKIDARRSDKKFPLSSEQINRELGAFVVEKTKKKVNLTSPDLTIFIEITPQCAYVYFEKIQGPSGLPVGSSGEILSMISSGIDSPVASWQMMKRGAKINFIHFHSYPQTSKNSIENVKEQVKKLNEYQYNSTLYLAPFLEIQKEIYKHAPENYRVIMYRYFMFKIAEAVAKKNKIKVLATGESLGQVASQTIDNIYAVNQFIKLPVFRPLIGENKEETISKAREIGTYEISIRPAPDCCTLFVPKHPETKSNPQIIKKLAAKIDKKIIKDAIKNIEVLKF